MTNIISNNLHIVNDISKILLLLQDYQMLNMWRSREKVVATVVDNAVALLE